MLLTNEHLTYNQNDQIVFFFGHKLKLLSKCWVLKVCQYISSIGCHHLTAHVNISSIEYDHLTALINISSIQNDNYDSYYKHKFNSI